jgi:hypothetical protein
MLKNKKTHYGFWRVDAVSKKQKDELDDFFQDEQNKKYQFENRPNNYDT